MVLDVSEVPRLVGVYKRADYSDRPWSVCCVRRPVKRNVSKAGLAHRRHMESACQREGAGCTGGSEVVSVVPGHWDCEEGTACDIPLEQVRGLREKHFGGQ